jgi:hypothetical protein
MSAVEKDVAMPANPRNWKYPWASLGVGDSFYVEGRTHKYWTSLASARKRRSAGQVQYSVRRDGKGFRIWRVKPEVRPDA